MSSDNFDDFSAAQVHPLLLTKPVREEDLKVTWERSVRQHYRDQCSNCGIADRLQIQMNVPLEAGGQYVIGNASLLCRSCSLAQSAVQDSQHRERANRPLNFWMSRKLHDSLVVAIDRENGFRSMGAMVRSLMTQYITDPNRFEDLSMFQDEGSDVKVNIWVDPSSYVTFKSLVSARGLSVTQAIKSLILIYQSGAETLLKENES